MTENEQEPTKETTLTSDDLTNIGAALENYVAGEAEAAEQKQAAETQARARLRRQDPKDVKWWDMTPPAERGSGPRPACTYRAARRNAARAAGWPHRKFREGTLGAQAKLEAKK
jgi:hypothetical protein